ncbi:MAG: lysoplasmalogenase [Chloroflexi bacterium]|nr:lysoplasmalogenase [Chloroflexota bacterium]
MYFPLIPIPIYLVLIILYMIARNRNDLKRTSFIQPTATFLAMIIAALGYLSPAADQGYTTWILVGLGLCFLADIFNIDMTNDKVLYAAIGVFVIAYLEYAVTFTRFNGFQRQDLVVAGAFILIYILLMRLYWKGLGNFKIPILIYGLVMPFMVTRAISTLFGSSFSLVSAILVTVGCTMLFLGDVEYGLHRFRKPLKFFFGPICYAGGQLLIALSCSYFLLH